MMLFTSTFSPPSCRAMLPQKFSAATTRSFPEPDSWLGSGEPQPTSRTPHIAAPTRRIDATSVRTRLIAAELIIRLSLIIVRGGSRAPAQARLRGSTHPHLRRTVLLARHPQVPPAQAGDERRCRLPARAR